MKKNLLIAAVMLFALSTVAMAQFVPGARYTVASVPETFVSCCGQTEKTGDIGFTAVPGSPDSVTGTITVTYAVPVTNAVGTAYGNGIWAQATATTASGSTGTAPAVSVVSVVPSDANGRGVVTISIGAGGVYPYTITLSGVRVNVSGSCGGSVSANITSTGNLLTSGETSVVVISEVKKALANPTTTAITVNGVTGEMKRGTTSVMPPTAITIPFSVAENFLDAFGKVPADDPSANMSKIIRLSVSKVPAGVTLTFPLTSSGGLFQLSNSAGTFNSAGQTVTNATSPTQVYYRLLTSSNAAASESLSFDISATNAGPYPLSGAAVTISAHIAPIDATNALRPRFADLPECETSAVQILSIYGASTTLLVPYAVNMSGLLGYNTGLAVANTTTDPGTTLMGFTTAVKQAGAMTFYFYPQTGTPFTYTTTAGSPGSGLNSDGTLKTGGSYVVLLDQLLTAAGQSLDFTGYIFIITNFTNAHGQYFITNFEEFTNGALMLVVNNESVGRAGPERLDN